MDAAAHLIGGNSHRRIPGRSRPRPARYAKPPAYGLQGVSGRVVSSVDCRKRTATVLWFVGCEVKFHGKRRRAC